MGSKAKKNPRLFVVYCEEDDSHTTLEENDVICESSVKVGDEVSFFCRRKARWLGVVKAIGDNWMEMNQIRDKLNARKPKRDGSFHAENKRKTAVKALSNLRQLSVPSRSTSQKVSNETEHPTPADKMTSAERRYFTKLKNSLINYEGSDPETEPVTSHSDDKDEERLSASNEEKADLSTVSDEEEHASPPKKRGSILRQVLSSVIDNSASSSDSEKNQISGADDKNDSSLSDESLTAEEIAALQKQVARKKKMKDINQLIAFSKEESSVGASGSSFRHSVVSTQLSKVQRSQNEAPQDSSHDQDSQLEGSSGPSKPVMRSRYCPRYKKKVFSGESFLYKADDPGVEKLWPSYNVYVLSEDLHNIKRKARTGNEVARLLVNKVFSEEAIKQCSVTGRPASGRGRENSTLRPPLNSDGVGAITEFAKARSKKKHWKDVTATEVKKAMSNVLVELRYYERLAGESEASTSSV